MMIQSGPIEMRRGCWVRRDGWIRKKVAEMASSAILAPVGALAVSRR